MTKALRKHPLKRFREGFSPPMTLADAAGVLGCDPATVHKWEARQRIPSPKFLARIVRLTRAPLAELIGLSDPAAR